MDKLEKLKLKMLEARAAYQKFMDDHKRPMTPEEELEHNKGPFRSFDFSDSEGESIGEQISGPETFVVELKTIEEGKEMKRLDDETHETYRVFVNEYKKKDWTHE